MMKICHMHSHMRHNGVGTSGAALIRQQAARGHEIVLVHRPGAWIADQTFPENVLIEPMDMGVRLLNYRDCRRMRRLLEGWGCDVLHTHGMGADRIGALAYYWWDVASVAHAHALHRHHHWRFHDAVIGPSQYTRDWFVNGRRVRPERFHIVHNFVPENSVVPRSAKARAAVLAEFGLNPDAFVIGVVGAIVPRKNQSAALPLVADLRARGIDAQLLLAGRTDESEIDTVRARTKDLGIPDAVHVLGNRDDIMQLQAGFDVGLSMSRDEQGSLVLIEALGAGLPYMTTPVGMATEIIEPGANGWLIDRDDLTPAADYMTRLAQDADFAAAQGTAARRTFDQNFQPGPILDRYDNVYRTAIARRL